MTIDFSTAPDLDMDDFGVIVRGRSYWGGALAPSTAGDGWSLYILFRDHIVRRGPWSVHEVNLAVHVEHPDGDGQVTAERSEQTEQVIAHYGTEDEPAQLFAFPDGQIYVPVSSAFYRLNLQTKSFDELPIPCGDYWYWREGRDGAVYLCGSGQRRMLRFDFATDTFEDYGSVGHAQGGILARMWEYGDVTEDGEVLLPLAVDARCLYLVTGQLPRALWAMDLQTREQRVLFCIVDPDKMALAQRDEACYAVVERTKEREVYRLNFEDAKRVESLPPRPAQPRPVVAGVPLPDLASGIPLAVSDYHGTGMCEADSTATVYYRPPEGDWRSVTFELGSYPSYLFRMGSTADGQLLCSSEDPYTLFTFDPKTRQTDILGPSPLYTHVYGFAEAGGKIYFAGYTGSPLFEYDPARPWNYQPPKPNQKTPMPSSENANPRLVARMPFMRRAYDVLLGADGRLYLPCSAEMTGPIAAGGGLGWYDPTTGKVGLIRDGFTFHRGHTATTACNGRYVVVATTAWWPRTIDPEFSGVPDRVVTYDVRAGKVVGDVVPASDAAGGGEVVEWRPGKIVGRLRAQETSGTETVFYILDVASQQVESTFRLPGKSASRLLCLTDGQLLGYHNGGVYRLNPAAWAFTPVCKLDTPPRDWRIVKGQVYAFLETRLVRLTNVI